MTWHVCHRWLEAAPRQHFCSCTALSEFSTSLFIRPFTTRLFPVSKTEISPQSRRFDDAEGIKLNTTKELHNISVEDFSSCFDKWQQWRVCELAREVPVFWRGLKQFESYMLSFSNTPRILPFSRAGICLFSGNSLPRDSGAKQGRKHIAKIEKFSIYRTQIAVKSITKLVQSRFAHIPEPQNIENISSW